MADTTFSRLRYLREHYRTQHCSASLLSSSPYTCVFCEEEMNVTEEARFRRIGYHMEELAFATVPQQYESWDFYSDSKSLPSIDVNPADREKSAPSPIPPPGSLVPCMQALLPNGRTDGTRETRPMPRFPEDPAGDTPGRRLLSELFRGRSKSSNIVSRVTQQDHSPARRHSARVPQIPRSNRPSSGRDRSLITEPVVTGADDLYAQRGQEIRSLSRKLHALDQSNNTKIRGSRRKRDRTTSVSKPSLQIPSEVREPSAAQLALVVEGVVLSDFKAERADELEVKRDETVVIIAISNSDWFVAKPMARLGGPGLIPVAWIEVQDTKTGQSVKDSLAAARAAGVPSVEKWKRAYQHEGPNEEASIEGIAPDHLAPNKPMQPYAERARSGTRQKIPEPPLANVFSSAIPWSDSPTEEEEPSGRSISKPQVLFTAASIYDFHVDRQRREAGFRYLMYVTGELFDVIGERGELWLAKNQDDPQNEIGWIWNRYMVKLAE